MPDTSAKLQPGGTAAEDRLGYGQLFCITLGFELKCLLRAHRVVKFRAGLTIWKFGTLL